MAGVQSMAAVKEWADFDVWESGDLMVTIGGDSAMYDAGQFDQVILAQSSEPFSLVMRVGRDDFFRWPVLQVDRGLRLGADGLAEQLPVPEVDDSGELVWPEGEAPAVNSQFSISGRRRPVYYLFKDLPRDRAHHSGRPLPRRVVVRAFDLFGRSD